MAREFKWAIDSDMSRRSFIALSAVAGASVALAPHAQAFAEEHNSGSVPSGTGIQRIRTECRGCGKMECSVWVTVQDGRAIKIEGDEANFGAYGNCCSKSQASLQACYHPDRLRFPLKRTNPKGSDDPGWVRISWQEALDTAAAKITEIKEQRGHNALFSMAGTSRIWSMTGCGGMAGLLNSANNHQAYQICKGPRHVGTTLQSNRAFSWMATVDRPRVLVVWGGGAEISNYDDSCRTMVDCAAKADKFIIVDPRLSNLGKEADIWLPLRPGTDGAMALGWLNVIINKKLYNEMWLKRWTNLPYLVVEDMDATPSYAGGRTPGAGSLWDGRPVMTKLLKESDLLEEGSDAHFMVYDKISGGLVYCDANTGLWQGEAPLNITTMRDLPGKEAVQPNLTPGIVQGYVPDLSDFSRCDPLIDPDYEIEQVEVTLKDGTTAIARPAWYYFKKHVMNYDVNTVAEITGVDAALIEEAAVTYATPIDPTSGYGNGGIQYMLAIEHSCNSVQCVRALDAIVGLTNNFDTPAGNRGPTKGCFNSDQFAMGGLETRNMDDRIKSWGQVAGVRDIPMLPQLGIWGDSTGCWDCCNRSERAAYPMYGAICQAGDVMNMSNSYYGWQGLMQLDFLLDLDLWHTPTSQLADILLPVRHWLEVDCQRTSQGSAGLEGANCKCVAPLAETWYDPDIMIQLSKRLGKKWKAGTTDKECWPDSVELLCDLAKNYDPLTKDYPGENSWERFKSYFQEQGCQDVKVVQPDVWGSYRRFEGGCALVGQLAGGGGARFGKVGLATPTTKQEIYNTRIESFHSVEHPFYGQDIPNFSRPDEKSADFLKNIGPFTLPTYTEPPEGPVANPEYAKDYPLIMTTGRRIPVYFHSEHRQLPWCRELWPTPRCEINPADAKELGIEQGDWVWIETPRHKIRQVADLYYGIRKGTINCEHQWWMPEFKAAMKGYDLININTLVNKDLRDPICGSSYVRAYNVKVYKATPENSPNGNPVPCDIDGKEMISSCHDPRLKEWLPVVDNEETRKNYAERNGVQI